MTGLRLHRHGPVATVTLDRPERRNAQTPEMWEALAAIGRDLPGDVRVVVVRGTGPSFSAGLDVDVLARGVDLPADDGGAETVLERFQQAFAWLGRNDLVSVAAVQGHAVGAGFQLALACDLRVCADDARFAMAETSLGLVPDLGGTAVLVALAGYARALEICLTGRQVGAAEAERIGLANLVVPAAELDAAVDDLVAALLAPPRDAVVETKALLAGARHRSPAEQRAAERAAQVRRLRDLAGTAE